MDRVLVLQDEWSPGDDGGYGLHYMACVTLFFFKCYNFKKGGKHQNEARQPPTRGQQGGAQAGPLAGPGDIVGCWEVTGLRLSCRFSHAGTCPEREAAALTGFRL